MKTLMNFALALFVTLSMSAMAQTSSAAPAKAPAKAAKTTAAAKDTTKTGVITDPMCAKSGDMAKMSDAECAKKCAQDGKYAFVSGKTVYSIDNVDAVKGHEGHKVVLTGAFAKDSVHVTSLKMAGNTAKKTKKEKTSKPS